MGGMKPSSSKSSPRPLPSAHDLLGRSVRAFIWYVGGMLALGLVGYEAVYGCVTPFYGRYAPLFDRLSAPVLLALAAVGIGGRIWPPQAKGMALGGKTALVPSGRIVRGAIVSGIRKERLFDGLCGPHHRMAGSFSCSLRPGGPGGLSVGTAAAGRMDGRRGECAVGRGLHGGVVLVAAGASGRGHFDVCFGGGAVDCGGIRLGAHGLGTFGGGPCGVVRGVYAGAGRARSGFGRVVGTAGTLVGLCLYGAGAEAWEEGALVVGVGGRGLCLGGLGGCGPVAGGVVCGRGGHSRLARGAPAGVADVGGTGGIVRGIVRGVVGHGLLAGTERDCLGGAVAHRVVVDMAVSESRGVGSILRGLPIALLLGMGVRRAEVRPAVWMAAGMLVLFDVFAPGNGGAERLLYVYPLFLAPAALAVDKGFGPERKPGCGRVFWAFSFSRGGLCRRISTYCGERVFAAVWLGLHWRGCDP